MTIKIESEVLRGMAGEMTYHTMLCPFNVIGIGGSLAKVGSTQCQMCQHYGGVTDDSESVVCNHASYEM